MWFVLNTYSQLISTTSIVFIIYSNLYITSFLNCLNCYPSPSGLAAHQLCDAPVDSDHYILLSSLVLFVLSSTCFQLTTTHILT